MATALSVARCWVQDNECFKARLCAGANRMIFLKNGLWNQLVAKVRLKQGVNHPVSENRTRSWGAVITICARPDLIQPFFSQALSVRLTVYKVVPE